MGVEMARGHDAYSEFAELQRGSRLKTETKIETVKNYLRNSSIEGELNCEELPGKGTNKAFRVGVPFKDLGRINSPDFWPSGVMIRRFR
jgi:hypothetical protein